MAGVTGQIKWQSCFNRGFHTILNAKQNFDGGSSIGSRGFGGVLFNGTVGITVYLGKNENTLTG
jgi:OOP family OmpA-OmpF porin